MVGRVKSNAAGNTVGLKVESNNTQGKCLASP